MRRASGRGYPPSRVRDARPAQTVRSTGSRSGSTHPVPTASAVRFRSMSRRSVDPLTRRRSADGRAGRRPSDAGRVGIGAGPVRPGRLPGRFDWGEAGGRAISARVGLVVVVDVLSFSTSTCVAVRRGAPWSPPGRPGSDGPGGIAGAIGRSGTDLGLPTLWPAGILGSRAGETLVLASPNGAVCAVDAGDAGAMVVVGCLGTPRRSAAWSRRTAASAGVPPPASAGRTAGWPALEDLLGAGAFLVMVVAADLSPEAQAAAAGFSETRVTMEDEMRGCGSGPRADRTRVRGRRRACRELFMRQIGSRSG